MLGELLDRIAAIEQDAFVAVDIGDLGFAARGRGEARIVSEHPGLPVELRDVDDAWADRAVMRREFDDLIADRDRADDCAHVQAHVWSPDERRFRRNASGWAGAITGP